jgi:post-segregation antitoxin (ccd killing protein)
MPKMQVYLPDELHARVKAQQPRLNVSAILQEALEAHLAVLGRRQALDEAIADYEAEFGVLTQEELDRQVADDLRNMVFPGSKATKATKAKKRKSSSAA